MNRKRIVGILVILAIVAIGLVYYFQYVSDRPLVGTRCWMAGDIPFCNEGYFNPFLKAIGIYKYLIK